jgi:hypothetical protein
MTDQQRAAIQAAIDCLVGVAIGKYDGNAAEVSANLRAALTQQERTKPAAWIDGSGHPRHISYVQSATERRLYGPLRPLYEWAPQQQQQEPDWESRAEIAEQQVVSLSEELERCKGLLRRQQEQGEPVAYLTPPYGALVVCHSWKPPAGMEWPPSQAIPLVIANASQPPRKRLTDEQIVTMYAECPTCDQDMIDFARAIERAHGIGGEHG